MLPYKNDDREEFRELFKEIELLIEDNEMIKRLNSCNIKDIKNILIWIFYKSTIFPLNGKRCAFFKLH